MVWPRFVCPNYEDPKMMRLSLAGQRTLVAATALCLSLTVTAQCELEWQPGPSAPGPVGQVRALAETANGDLIATGLFRVAGSELANNIARYDGTNWRGLGLGVGPVAKDVAVLPNGDIFVIGSLNEAGGMPVSNAAIWDGTDWSGVGGGLDGYAHDLAVLSNGDVIVVGDFDNAGGIACRGVACWNGSSWSAMQLGLAVQRPSAVAVGPNDEIYVGGTSWPGLPDIQRWNGTAWTSLSGLASNLITGVTKLLVLPNGDLAISGGIGQLSGGGTLGLYDGSTLQSVDPQVLGGATSALAIAPNGDLLIGATLVGSAAAPLLLRFDGSSWTNIGLPAEGAAAALLVASNGSIVIGYGSYGPISGPSSGVAELVGITWSPIGDDPGPEAFVTQALPNGDMVVGGRFAEIEGVPANNIARWDGSSWHAMGQGVDGSVTKLAAAPDGTLIVAGEFGTAGGAPANKIAQWDGFAWSTLGAGLPGEFVRSVAVNGAGEVLALGSATGQQLRLFDGQSWSGYQLPGGMEVIALPSDEFLIVGTFVGLNPLTFYGAYRFDGGALTLETSSQDFFATSALVDSSGDVVLAGIYQFASAVVRLSTGQPESLSIAGSITDLAELPSGDLLVVGPFTPLVGNQPLDGILRWDGATASSVNGGVPPGTIESIAIGRRGEVMIAGRFEMAGGNVSMRLARAVSSCPASVATFGAGCAGSAGSVTLVPDGLPWIGDTFEAKAQGMAAQSLALHAIGETSALAPLLLGAPGCSLFVAPLFTELLSPQNGEVRTSLTIPAAPVLVGVDVFSQVIGLELSSGFALTQTTGTNALQLTIGSF